VVGGCCCWVAGRLGVEAARVVAARARAASGPVQREPEGQSSQRERAGVQVCVERTGPRRPSCLPCLVLVALSPLSALLILLPEVSSSLRPRLCLSPAAPALSCPSHCKLRGMKDGLARFPTAPITL
jgi:hypothetical protein